MKRNGTSKLNICFVRSLLVFFLLLALMLPMVSICCSAASVGSSILAAVYTDETYSALLRDDISICISGKLPRGAYAKAYPAGSNGFTGVVYAAYDITVFDGQGNVYEPGNSPLSVSMTSPAIAEAAKSGAEFDQKTAPEKPERLFCAIIGASTQIGTILLFCFFFLAKLLLINRIRIYS